jgi:hypothetical protein
MNWSRVTPLSTSTDRMIVSSIKSSASTRIVNARATTLKKLRDAVTTDNCPVVLLLKVFPGAELHRCIGN